MNPYLIIGALLAIIGAYFYGESVGEDSANATWLKRENTELTEANAKIIELTARNRAIEQKAAQDQNAIETKLVKEKKDGLAKKDRIIADLRSGALKLRGAAACESPGGSPRPAATPDPGGTPTSKGSQFSEADGEFFVREAGRADDNTIALNACIAILQSDRAAINR